MVTPYRWRRGIRRSETAARTYRVRPSGLHHGSAAPPSLTVSLDPLTPRPPTDDDRRPSTASASRPRRSVWTRVHERERRPGRLTAGRPTETADLYRVEAAAIARTHALARRARKHSTITAESKTTGEGGGGVGCCCSGARRWWGWWCEDGERAVLTRTHTYTHYTHTIKP